MSKLSSLDFACANCQKKDAEAEECRIYQYKFKVFGKRCPRQEPEEAEVIAEVAGDQYLELPLELIYWKEPVRTAIKQEDIQNMAVSTVLGEPAEIFLELKRRGIVRSARDAFVQGIISLNDKILQRDLKMAQLKASKRLTEEF
jgi:hypothetical protein